MRKDSAGVVVLTLDFAKAYENINWVLLLDLLGEMGFGHKWVKWMEECVTTATLTIW